MVVGSTTQIRWVRCPTCRNVLPEFPDVPVYQCGGCSTLLQAKKQVSNATSMRPMLDEPDSAQKNKSSHVTEDKESSSLNPEANLHYSMKDCSSEQNNGKDCIKSDDCSSDGHTAANSPNEYQNNAPDQHEYGDLCTEQFRGTKTSNEDEKDLGKENASGDAHHEQLGYTNTSNADQDNRGGQNELMVCNFEKPGNATIVTSSQEFAHLEIKELSLLAGSNLEEEVNEESLPAAGSKTEIDMENEGSSCSGRLSSEKLVDTKDVAPIVTERMPTEENISSDVLEGSDSKFRRSAIEKVGDIKGSTSGASVDRPTKESISPDILISYPKGKLEEPQKSAHCGFDHARYADTSEATDFVNRSSELSGTLIDLSKSPTTRSSRAYYDDGVSSCEGADYQLPARYKHSSKTACKPANYAGYGDRPRRVSSNFEARHQLRNCSSVLSDNSQYPVKSGDQDEFLGSTRVGHPVSNWQRLERDGYPYQLPFYQRGSLAGYETGSPSNQMPHEFQRNPLYHLHDKHSYTEQERMQLLRMVCELQDQLTKASSQSEKENGRVSAGCTWKDHHIPMYHVPEFLEDESFRNSNYHGHARFREGSNWPQDGEHPQTSFSAEAMNCRRRADHSSQCFPLDWQYSAQVPPPGVCHSCVPSGINIYNSYGSCPSSPQWLAQSEIPLYGCETKSDDQIHRHQDLKKYCRDKHRLAKRHLRPMAGGAPFITCPHCLKQLRLPADFLLFERRCHRLRCGSCSEVLKFSLLNRTHLISYTPTVKTPPPSEIDEYNDAVNKRNTSSRPSDCLHMGPSSFSDDVSFGKSCSTDRDHIFQTSSHTFLSSEVGRNVTYGRHEHSEDRKKFTSSEPENKYKNPEETGESAGPSSGMSKPKNVSSEIEELPGGESSPLHRLMGYSSARELIYGCGSSGFGTS